MDDVWKRIEAGSLAPEGPVLTDLIRQARLDCAARARVAATAAGYVAQIRSGARPGLMEVFLAEYGLSTDEGIALMCLAEALLRVPDAATMDALIEDKIAPSDWGRHLGRSASSLVNASTWALMLTGRVLDDREPGVVGHLRAAVKRLGEPVIRLAVGRAMKEMGRQFVLGETIGAAMSRARLREAQGYTYSYDMLGEAARTADDAARYARSYADAIASIATACTSGDVRTSPGISVKLSALHPRYEVAQAGRVMSELVPVVLGLARSAAAAGMGFNIDAEEADRLTLSLRVVEAVLADPALAGWDGFGVVVQAYGRRAGPVIDWLYGLAARLDRRIMVRLVKGAYWDAEIKRAQVLGLADFPVFTRKIATDVSYVSLARRLLGMGDRIYPQFATHNAHTVAAVLHMAGDVAGEVFGGVTGTVSREVTGAMGAASPREPSAARGYEFQRLHGMGVALHDIVLRGHGAGCRIYAPVGAHRDLLAYLVRRLLENGANSSFVNQIVDEDVPPEVVAACPLTAWERLDEAANPALPRGPRLFAPERRNSLGFDLTDSATLTLIDAARAPFAAGGVRDPAREAVQGGDIVTVRNPATGVPVGQVAQADPARISAALARAQAWQATAAERAAILDRAADLYEQNRGEIFALLAREAGKTLADAVGELREAVDFLRYYAAGASGLVLPARGIFTCISPWNFPLAIFTGQIAAALAAGNGVIAKPAPQTPLIAALGVRLLHRAGVPPAVLQMLAGAGDVGAALVSDPRAAGVVFTGSTATALRIRAAMARGMAPGAPLIAETGGMNAMIVDSTALPEQAVRDIIASAFQSAGQRCSALRCLYLQEDIAPHVTEMLVGAMNELRLGDPWSLATDIGPVIDEAARDGIAAHVARARKEGRMIHELPVPEDASGNGVRSAGYFIGPALIRVPGIAALDREIFGPVLHLATFRAEQLSQVVAAINATGYGLTFGLHSRIDGRVQDVTAAIRAGNIYVNRNQIGAVVGSQPFGGEGLSGTGPKAGGPQYLARFAQGADVGETGGAKAGSAPESAATGGATSGGMAAGRPAVGTTSGGAPDRKGAGEDGLPDAVAADQRAVQAIQAVQAALVAADRALPAVATQDLPGPTGESNRLSLHRRAPLLCAGPGAAAVQAQLHAVAALGGAAVPVAGALDAGALGHGPGALEGFSGVLWWGDAATARDYGLALASRPGPILPLITGMPDQGHALLERHVCIDTTASGGNADLLAGAGSA